MELDEEELQLLAEEEAFLASGQRPSARLQHAASGTVTRKSRFMQQRATGTRQPPPPQERVVHNGVKAIPVMGAIVERATAAVSSPVAAFPSPGVQAFPVSGHRSQTGENLGSGLGKDLPRKPQAKTVEKKAPPAATAAAESTPADKVSMDRLVKRQLLENATELEVEKMKWMKGSPDDVEQGKKWRFTLDGLVAEDVQAAGEGTYQPELYHHGDEPDRPGYTLDELLHLSRSAVPAQRAVALQTLAAVMRAAKNGAHGSRPVLLALFQKDIAVYCRAALDDSTVTALVAAVDCLHALVSQPRDPSVVFAAKETYLQEERIRKLPMGTCKVMSLDEGAEGAHLEDANLARTNLLYVLVLRMNTVQRMRYILDVLAPSMPAAALVQLIEIALRFCDHSSELSLATFGCPYFVEAALKFIKKSLDAGRVTACELSLRLVISFVHGNAACARVLLSSSDGGPSQLQQLLSKFISGPEENIPPTVRHLAVTIASTLMQYEGIGPEHVGIHASTFSEAIAALAEDSAERISLRLALVGILRREVAPLEVLATLRNRLDQMVAATIDISEASHPRALYHIVNYWTCVRLCHSQDLASGGSDDIREQGGSLLRRLVPRHLEALAAFQEALGGPVAPRHSAIPQLPPCSGFTFLDALGRLCSELLMLASPLEDIGSIWELVQAQRCMEAALCPSLAMHGAHLMASSNRFHLSLFDAVTSLTSNADSSKGLIFNRTLLALLWLHPGDESLLRDMVGRLFEPSNITAVLSVIRGVGKSQMDTLLSSAKSLRNAFLICLCGKEASTTAPEVTTLFLDTDGSMLPLRPHWMYLPLRIAFSEREASPPVGGDGVATRERQSPSQAPFVTAGLLFILATLNNRVLTEEEKAFGVLEILRVVLLPGQLYLEPTIHSLLSQLREKFSPAPGQSLTFEPLPDSGGLYNLIADVIEEYAASSFGDTLFTSFILLFITMEQPLEFRKVVWRELSHMLRFLQPAEASMHEQELGPYLYPLETDKEAISLMIAALEKGSLQERQNPFLFSIAVHHIAAYCFNGFSGDAEKYMGPWAAGQLLEGVSLPILARIASYSPPGTTVPSNEDLAARKATLGVA